ncbi:MAG: sigma 54-interacting transcriptional regulator [Nitrospirales bacterium]|nr:sigma 54-interacting transcriptional regulator [Nitrospirales bacterium]
MMTKRLKTILLAFGFAVGGTLSGFSVVYLFPQMEQVFLKNLAIYLAHSPVSSRLVLVTPPSGTNRVCSDGRWHPSEFETMILAMNQARASVVTSLEDFSHSNGSGCGDLGSLARLAETTKRVGNVLYPYSASAMLRQAAVGVGVVTLSSEKDQTFMDVTLPSSTDSNKVLPLGLAATTFVMNREHSPTTLPEAGRRLFFSIPPLPDFPVQSFETVQNLWQAGDIARLQNLFQGKIVIVSPQSVSFPFSMDGWDTESAVAFLHAQLAHTAITRSWLSVVPIEVAMVLIMLAAFPLAFFILQPRRTNFFMWVGLAGFLGSLVVLVILPQSGWLWPLAGTIISVSFTSAGSLIWRTFHSQANFQARIHEGQGKLMHLKDELIRKQQHVRELESRLEEVRSEAHESVSVISGLQESQDAICRQLQDSEKAVAVTRNRIRHLQDELVALRQQLPGSLSRQEASTDPDDQSLMQECAGFNILTKDPKMLELFERLKKASMTPSPILLLGETGTGKEVFARAAHALSPRRSGPFVSVNMAAIRPELFEGELFGHVKGAFTGAVGRVGLLQTANGGTLFLDEVGELPPDVQAKLLRVLEEGSFYRVGDSRVTTVDVRIVAATNRNLEKEIVAGRYREDLYYRLRSIVLTLPPLRERVPEDRLLLAQSFLVTLGAQQGKDDLGMTQGAIDAILAYRWPGNIRELRQTIAQAVALTEESIIAEPNLQLPKSRGMTTIGRAHGQEDRERVEDIMVLQCLRRHRFDMQATAREMGWDRSTVTQRLKGLGFQALVEYHQDVHEAARSLAGDEALVRVVEGRLREYAKNLLPTSKHYRTVEEAIADCRKRFRNLPERHFSAVERLIQERMATSSSS